MMRTVLFLCTGNYYRSRFAEELFNHRAETEGLAWKAGSRALAIERGINNVGPLSPFALAALYARGVVTRGAQRLPQACTAADLAGADRIVALSEREHRILMRERFPAWESRTAFWQIEDIEFAPPDVALALVAREVETMLAVLRSE
jgi:protein-tyrosine-phosphatase